jgi:hypothetical protein
MSQMGGPGYRPSAKSNIYTVLVVIAFLALVGGIVSVWLRGKELYGSSNPFDMKVEIKEPSKTRPAAPAADAAASGAAPAAGGTAPAAGGAAAPAAPAAGGAAPAAPGAPAAPTPPAN